MNQKLKRYYLSVEYKDAAHMAEHEDGDYVTYSDYQKLQEKLAKSEKRYEPTGRDTKNGFIELRQLVGMRYGLLIYPCGFKHEGHFITAEDAEWIIEQKRIENEKLQEQLGKAEEALNKAINTADFFSRYADCRKDSWACKCEFCRDTTPTKNLNYARQYFKEKENK